MPNLEDQINTARTLTSLALSLRKKRTNPCSTTASKNDHSSEKIKQNEIALKKIIAQLKSEINIKTVELLDDANSLLVKEIKPNFKALGPRFGKDVKSVVQCIKDLDEDQINELEGKGTLEIQLNEKNITLESSDVEVSFKDIEGWQVAQGSGMTVALDMTMTPELIQEGDC